MQKIKYYSDQFEKNKSSIRHTWSTLKEILNKCKIKKVFQQFLQFKEKKTDKTDISNSFNSFVANIGANLSNDFKYTGDKTVSSYLKQRHIFIWIWMC